MAFYVIAFTDAPASTWRAGDRTFSTMKVADGIYAAGQSRRAAPRPSEEELRFQHALVVALAARVPAILPVRFGSLIERPTLRRLVSEHSDTIHAALDNVRGRVQMTLRIVGRRPRPRPPVRATASGRHYLEARRAAADPLLPLPAAKILRLLKTVVVEERREAGAGQLLATIYHLVNADDVRRYRKAAAGRAAAGAILTGPWPPFAFTPRLF